jgi:hypothetical protein
MNIYWLGLIKFHKRWYKNRDYGEKVKLGWLLVLGMIAWMGCLKHSQLFSGWSHVGRYQCATGSLHMPLLAG